MYRSSPDSFGEIRALCEYRLHCTRLHGRRITALLAFIMVCYEKKCPIPTQSLHSPVVKVSDHGRHVMSSIPVPLKTRLVGERYTLNLSRSETSFCWCGS
ncbi:hypothetical protein TNCV_878951 [Trichonephila clavipes]|nr:hypothetical protein TNCV_878951 [Trichonephila clavipes]